MSQPRPVQCEARFRTFANLRSEFAEMVNSTLLLVLSGCVLGAVQLGVGIALGIWLLRRRPTDIDRSGEIAQAARIAHKLQALADDMSSSVGEHRSQLEEASRLLADTNSGTDNRLADLVAGVIGDVVGASQTLQSRLKSAEVRLQEQATEIEAHMSRALTDALTGLPNRRMFNERLEANMSNWRKRGEVFTLLMLDVDHFKQLNDRFGHVAGDHVLTTVANALRTKLRWTDVVARYGGEEFVILFPATTLNDALSIAHNTLQTIAEATMAYQGHEFKVTVSGGLAMIRAGEDSAELVRRADAALYAAKAAGRNCIFVQEGLGDVPLVSLLEHLDGGAAARCNASGDAEQLHLLLGMIESLVAAEDVVSAGDPNCKAPLQHEQISSQLAEACCELRRCLENRVPAERQSAS